MDDRSTRLATLVVVLIAGSFVVPASGDSLGIAEAQDCARDTIGLDAFQANHSTGALLGEARGQSFTAHDTLIEFLRVWRIASEDSAWYIGMHPYIVETNSQGVPDVRRIVWEGPTLIIPDGDGVNPIEFKWTFDPPLVLPHTGLYVFFLFQDPCLAYFDVLSTDQYWLYAEGDFWSTDRSDCRLYTGIGLNHEPRGDLVFQIGFCRDVQTRTRRDTWGRLKLIYR